MTSFYRCAPVILLAVAIPSLAQQAPAPSTTPTIKANVDEVVLDLVVRDKKGKPVTGLTPDDITVSDNGAKQTLTSFRLVSGSEAISQSGAATPLDMLRQVRLVTLAFDSMNELSQRKTARSAAVDLINGEQGTNVYYSVVVVDTRLLVLQQFTKDKAALTKAIDRATTGLASGQLFSESETIRNELKRNLNGQTVNGADQNVNLIASATQTANTPPGPGSVDPLAQTLARVMLDMLRMDAAAVSQGTRLSLASLKALVQGLQEMPGRKSILYFTQGLYVGPELDMMFRNLMSMANRANVTFYSVDTRGVMTFSQNSGATSALNGAAAASATTSQRIGGAVTKDEVLASDNAENSGRENLQLPIRDLAEATGGFLIGDSNDLRGPLRRVNEEISSYYELTYNPGIKNYDGSFRKVSVSGRKDLVIHARNGYFALPPEERATGIEPFEMPLLKALSEQTFSNDVEFRVAAVVLQPKADGTEVSLLAEVPLHGLQATPDPAKNTLSIHFSFDLLVKNPAGEVVQKLTRDRSLHITADQQKMGNFIDKMQVTLPAGKYNLESALMDRENGKLGTHRQDFDIAPAQKGVAISSLTMFRSYTPNVKNIDPGEPFQFQGGVITPTLLNSVPGAKDANLRLFFIIYKDAADASKPTVEVEFLQNGKVLTKVPLPLQDADANGKIPTLMTIPAASIPPGSYEIRAIAKQSGTSADARTTVKIEPS